MIPRRFTLFLLPVILLAQTSILNTQDIAPVEVYRVLWHISGADRESSPFVNLTGMALHEGGNWLYSVDRNLGVLQFDARTGAIIRMYPNQFISRPSGIAVDIDANVYVADPACGCIFVLDASGIWRTQTISGFSAGAPHSIAISLDGSLYATDMTTDELMTVRVIASDGQETITLPPDLIAQPLLFSDTNGVVFALTADGRLFTITDGSAQPVYSLAETTAVIRAASIDGGTRLFLAAESQGIAIYDSRGRIINRVGRIVAGFPVVGEVASPTGIAVGALGTIYLADSDGNFGAITAFAAEDTTGSLSLAEMDIDNAVAGELAAESEFQDWHFRATSGQRVTISAIDVSGEEQLDVAIRLLDPAGNEEAFNDDHRGSDLAGRFDAQLPDHHFAADGEYTIRVESVQGAGTYNLGITQRRPFELNLGGATSLNGEIGDVFPAQQWVFQGSAGQVFTITMQAETEDLDTILRLFGPDDDLLAQNDDALDPQLGFNSQIAQVVLPTDGAYTIEAARYSGVGDYSLVIVTTS